MTFWKTNIAMILIVVGFTATEIYVSWFPSVTVAAVAALIVGVARGWRSHTDAMKAASRWDTHNCRMPTDMPIHSAAGNIWNCHCGRRWKFIRYQAPNFPDGIGKFLWDEWTPEKELAEADRKLKKMGLAGTHLPSTLDVIERDR